jgi:hypothetical protein
MTAVPPPVSVCAVSAIAIQPSTAMSVAGIRAWSTGKPLHMLARRIAAGEVNLVPDSEHTNSSAGARA